MESYRKTHYTLRHRVIASISQRLDGLTYTQRHGLIRGMKRQGGLGFLPALLGGETAEHAFLRSLALDGRVVYEIGAFQGILTLFFSSRAKEVIAWEPNPPSYARVMKNLRLNGRTNVRLRNFAVGREPGMLTLLSDPLMPGGTSGDPVVASQIRASSTLTAIDVPVVTIDDEVASAGLPPPQLVKIDIEGMELPALQGMSRTIEAHHPDLYLEMHGATMEHKETNVAAIVAFLEAHHYSRVLHVETGTAVTAATARVAREGHIFATCSRMEEQPC